MVAIEIDAEERRRLVALGYLFPQAALAAPALDPVAVAVQAYFSDKIAAEKVTRHTA